MKILFKKQKLLNEISSRELKRTRVLALLKRHETPEKLQLKNIFKDKWRLAYPIGSAQDNFTDPRDKELLFYVDLIRKDLGFQVDLNEPFGYATKTSTFQKDGKTYTNVRKVKIGPLFAKLGKDAEEFWQRNNKFYTTEKNKLYFATKYTLVLSRHPIDILRMSDMDGWSSCHGTEGSYFKCAISESLGAGAISYIVKSNELQNLDLQSREIFSDRDRDIPGIQPVSRLRVRRYKNTDTQKDLAAPEMRSYGQEFPGFYKKLREILYEAQTDLVKEIESQGTINLNDWVLVGGNYEDNGAESILNKFFDEKVSFEGSLQGTVEAQTDPSAWKEEIPKILDKAKYYKNLKIRAEVKTEEAVDLAYIDYECLLGVEANYDKDVLNILKNLNKQQRFLIATALKDNSDGFVRFCQFDQEYLPKIKTVIEEDNIPKNYFVVKLKYRSKTVANLSNFRSFVNEVIDLAQWRSLFINNLIIDILQKINILKNPFEEIKNLQYFKLRSSESYLKRGFYSFSTPALSFYNTNEHELMKKMGDFAVEQNGNKVVYSSIASRLREQIFSFSTWNYGFVTKVKKAIIDGYRNGEEVGDQLSFKFDLLQNKNRNMPMNNEEERGLLEVYFSFDTVDKLLKGEGMSAVATMEMSYDASYTRMNSYLFCDFIKFLENNISGILQTLNKEFKTALGGNKYAIIDLENRFEHIKNDIDSYEQPRLFHKDWWGGGNYQYYNGKKDKSIWDEDYIYEQFENKKTLLKWKNNNGIYTLIKE